MPEDNGENQSQATTTEKTKDDEKQKPKEDEKLSIYKALAIKLKKELVKCRDELATLKKESQLEISQLKEQVSALEKTLEIERVTSTNANATLEATVKNYKKQLELAEQDMQTLHIEFEDYKTRATSILQQNQPVQTISSQSFFEERYKQLRSINEEQKEQIRDLRSQYEELTSRNTELDSEMVTLKENLAEALAQVESLRGIENDRDRLESENTALKLALKLNKDEFLSQDDTRAADICDAPTDLDQHDERHNQMNSPSNTGVTSQQLISSRSESRLEKSMTELSLARLDVETNRSANTSSASHNGDVSIKPTPIEIISRASVLEDAQNRIDVLTKAYLDSESTKSLLIEQVQALKEEIRRLQRGCERIELADNLEYLKNVILKYLSLDSSQQEQKQRLIPVITTVLKLSPDEVSQLNSTAQPERGGVTGMTTSFFKL